MQRVLNLTVLCLPVCLLGVLSMGEAAYSQNVLELLAVPQTPQVSPPPASNPSTAAPDLALSPAANPAASAAQ